MSFVLSSVSGNLISAASAGYAPTNSGDVSAIASAYQVVSATGTQLYAGTAFLTGVNGAPVSADRAGQAANASLANSAWYDGTGRFISALPDSAAVSAIASAYTTSKQDTLAFAYNTANQISSINGSALGGMDEAAVSGIASAYAEAAASGKLDSTAFNSADFYSTSNPSGFITGVDLSEYATTGYVDSSVSGKLDSTAFNSGDFYSTSNPSGFITGVDLSPYQTTAGMSGYIPTSMSSDFQQVTGMSSYALSADVSATVDLVGTQSANWGGSALALSAGPGVKLEKSGNVLVASTDETVLWSGSIGDEGDTASLSESIENFSHVSVYAVPVYGGADAVVTKFETRTGLNACKFGTWSQDGGSTYLANYNLNVSGNSAGLIRSKRIIINHSNGAVSVVQNSATGTYMAPITKIIGINRTSGV